HKMYDDLATWWPLLSPVEDYEEEAAFFWQIMEDAGLPASPSLLELGSGGGSNAFYLKKHFAQVTLTDLSPKMLAVSQAINPTCEHLEGSMLTLRLGRTFDVVFIHDAIDYMLTVEDLKMAMETAFTHCKSDGLALFIPDHVTETFEPSTEHGGTDGDNRALRYIEWTYDPDETDTTCVTDYVYLLREDNQPVRTEHEQHTHGLFPRAEWQRLLNEIGFTVNIVQDWYERDIFIARKP
ncbi:MAG: class I SAM-dependent methyltransferase, partial [Chloroflexota bacterium]